ncbi:hypothetical protein [Actinokineospora fastidiosa]|uniref:Secreted protein n=1 Tax=Actinokineospora fastidiosa TaxID=1816 RepID=A0A918GFP3_9PSEU|nr:hypothetical protein [Actinokineospora fastidiosa]GGS32946.1 hypothetical protein GCM10010171_28800 [Actinokineospora fastidiosa]
MRALRLYEWVAVGVAAVVAAGLLLVIVLTPGSPSAHTMPQAVVPAAHSDGLSDAENGYRMEPVTVPTERGDALEAAFRIIGPDGAPVTDFQVNQTKKVHFFVVRDDMAVFQHVHPELVGDTWRTRVALPDGGAYRMFAEFIPFDSADPMHPIVLGVPFAITGDTALTPVPAPAASTSTAAGFTVSRTDGVAPIPVRTPTLLRLAIRGPDGRPVEKVEPHLGASGHMTGFNTMLLSATHLHPVEPPGTPLIDGELTFRAAFAERGEHRLFLEFNVGGVVHTAALTVMVT